MRMPSLRTRILGHPLVALTVCSFGAYILYQWIHDGSLWLLGLGSIMAISAVMRASDQTAAYKTWKTAWDAMGDSPQPSRRSKNILGRLFASIFTFAMILYLVAHSDQPFYRLALVCIAITGLGGLMILLARGIRSRTSKEKPSIVTLAILRPIFAVPTVRQSYRKLPEHCLVLLGNRP